MDVLTMLAHGFSIASSPINLLFCLVGVSIGTAIGALPGIGPSATIAILIPFTYGKDHRAGYTRIYPVSQRACFSHDGGRTWDCAQEITLRGDAVEQAPGAVCSHETADGTILTLYAQTVLSDEVPSVEATRWSPPPKPRRARDARWQVRLGAPVTVTVGPPEERRWGFYQFPCDCGRTRDGALLVRYQTSDDSIGGGAHLPNTPLLSRDGGRRWRPLGAADQATIQARFVRRDGTELEFRGFPELRVGALGLRAYDGPRGGIWGVHEAGLELYRYSELPAERRILHLRRRAPGAATAEDDDAPLDFPTLAMIRYRQGWNSEQGVVALDDALRPGYLTWGLGGTVELDDGTLLTLVGCIQFGAGPAGRPAFTNAVLASTDGGRSWRHRGNLLLADPTACIVATEEANLVLRPGGVLVAVVRSEGPNLLRAKAISELWLTRSHDQGHTWSPPERLSRYTSLPRLLALANGVVACVHGRPGVDVQFAADPELREWSAPYHVRDPIGLPGESLCDTDATCGYTTLLATGPDRFLVAYADFYHRAADWTLHKAIKVREVRVVRR